MLIRSSILAGIAGAALSCSAHAADLSTKASPVWGAANAVNWTGFYAGGHLGYTQSRARFTDPSEGVSVSDSLKGFLGGGQAGFNYQFGTWVFGLEADISGSNADATQVIVDPASGDASQMKEKIRWTSLVTGRMGYAFDRALLYVKGGVAFGGFSLNGNDFDSGDTVRKSYSQTGWTVGGGLEYALNSAWSVRAEYGYVAFGNKTLTLTDSGG